MNKYLLFLIIIILIIGAGIAGYFYWTDWRKTPEEKALEMANEAVEKITESATQGVLPELGGQTNALEDKPDINPVSQTNPFSGIKTNPFK